MGKNYSEIPDNYMQFIKDQKIFFVGTATVDSRINISPKGMDSLRILGPNRVVWLNVTGSGNETATHIQENSRMTIMFVSFESTPIILRIYGSAKVIHRNDSEWKKLYALFSPLPGSRQIFDLNVDLVHRACGMAVPYFEFTGERNLLLNWSITKGDKGITEYWKAKNQTSLDGKPTNIMKKNT
ncbi:MAG: pyridoxamine 5'-phosphate oxidase family protein [bacterium]|nr:pyridoxamine 5'-phosphate oxidase family protein [bacterium]